MMAQPSRSYYLPAQATQGIVKQRAMDISGNISDNIFETSDNIFETSNNIFETSNIIFDKLCPGHTRNSETASHGYI